MLGGGAVSVGGMVMALSGVGTRCVRMDARDFGGCLQRENEELLIPGVVVGSAGLVAMLAGALVAHHPVDGLEARRLAEEYNEKLKGELGLAAAPTRSREPAVQVSVGGALLPGGGALVVGVRL
jgi:hypothetical protein